MNDTQNICLSCGLCCDGTLIGFVQLDREELPELSKIMEIEQTNGEGVFLHPCKKYCDGCSIYAQRPKQCAKFECGLLKSVEQKRLSFDAAVETIKAVKLKKTALEKKLAQLPYKLQSKSFYFQMAEVNNWIQKNESAPSKRIHSNILSDLEQLDRLLIKRFGMSLK